MKKLLLAVSLFAISLNVAAWGSDSENTKVAMRVAKQQAQYSKVQPIPFFNWSLERDMLIQLYNIRNFRAATHTVWRGDTSVIEGDCPSIGYGLPYDTSLSNPTTTTDEDQKGRSSTALASIGQAEPNGVFASTNTSATWVMCVNSTGQIEPIYVEAKVTGYPYPVSVDYDKNRVTKAGKATVTIKMKK